MIRIADLRSVFSEAAASQLKRNADSPCGGAALARREPLARPILFTGASIVASLRLTVYCASSDAIAEGYREMARALGRLIAERGHTLVYGGGRHGLMGDLSRAALASGGRVVGIILDRFIERGAANHEVREMRSVTDMRSRKRGLDEAGDAYLALPGGFGTLEEILEIISFKQLGLHARPVVLINTAGYFDPLLAQFARAFSEGFVTEDPRALYHVAADPLQALAFIEALLLDRGMPADGPRIEDPGIHGRG